MPEEQGYTHNGHHKNTTRTTTRAHTHAHTKTNQPTSKLVNQTTQQTTDQLTNKHRRIGTTQTHKKGIYTSQAANQKQPNLLEPTTKQPIKEITLLNTRPTNKRLTPTTPHRASSRTAFRARSRSKGREVSGPGVATW